MNTQPSEEAETNSIAEAILTLAGAPGAGKSVSPEEVARALAGDDVERWQSLLRSVRAVSIVLAREGRLVIYRKGKPVDPENFRGVYRLGLPVSEAS